MRVYYNEWDKKAAAWLRELISEGLLPDGDVDERSIEDVTPNELKPYTQCHFFAGVGGWPLALRVAGWPEDRPVWTGSPPCQSFSEAGKGKGFDDERHLWPSMFWLISQCRPSTIFGEQVASKLALEWWDLVASDLEGKDYAATAFDIPAASVGAFHRRHRLFWVGHSNCSRFKRKRQAQSEKWGRNTFASRAGTRSMANPNVTQWRQDADHRNNDFREEARRQQGSSGLRECCEVSRLANSQGSECELASDTRGRGHGLTNDCGLEYSNCERQQEQRQLISTRSELPSFEHSGVEWIKCINGKTRAVKPGIRLLANGVPGRVALLRGYGNAIVPQVAAEFIRANMEAAQERTAA